MNSSECVMAGLARMPQGKTNRVVCLGQSRIGYARSAWSVPKGGGVL